MTLGRGDRGRHGELFGSSFGGFLRSLLAGIPWSERAEGEELLHLEAPGISTLRLHNSNGRTCVFGEDRHDVEVKARKIARAESTKRRISCSIRSASPPRKSATRWSWRSRSRASGTVADTRTSSYAFRGA